MISFNVKIMAFSAALSYQSNQALISPLQTDFSAVLTNRSLHYLVLIPPNPVNVVT